MSRNLKNMFVALIFGLTPFSSEASQIYKIFSSPRSLFGTFSYSDRLLMGLVLPVFVIVLYGIFYSWDRLEPSEDTSDPAADLSLRTNS